MDGGPEYLRPSHQVEILDPTTRALGANALSWRPSESVNLSCAQECGRSSWMITRISVGQAELAGGVDDSAPSRT